jgi:hypothetical protein
MEALTKVHEWLRYMVSQKASDLFLTAGFPPAIKLNGKVSPISKQSLTPTDTALFAKALMTERQFAEYEKHHEANFALYRAGDRSLPRQRLRPAGPLRRGHAPHQHHHPQGRGPASAPGAEGHRHDAARSGDHGGRHRLGQIHHPGGDGRPPQP